MANIVDQLKKFFSRITTVNNPNEIPGSSIADVIAYATKNLNVNVNGNLISKLPEVIVPEGPEFVLTAFQNGDKIKKGTRLIFPKSQMANLEAFFRDRVANWSYGNVFDMLCVKEGSMLILTEEDGMGFFMLDTGMPEDLFWAGADYPDTGVTAGWQYQNLVDEGEYYVYTYPYGSDDEPSEIDIETDFEGKPYLDQWNGIMIGIDNSQVSEAPAFLYNLVPSEMTIQENNDGSRSYIKNIDGTIDNMLAGETYNITFEVNGETFTRVGKVIEGNGMQILMNELGNGPIDIIGDTTDYIRYSHYLNVALENGAPVEGKNAPFILTNGTYKDNTPTVKVISYTKQVQEQPEVVALTAFKNGDVIKAGSKYIFDKSKEAELLALAQSLEGSYSEQGQYTLLYSDNLSRTIIGFGKTPGDIPTYVLMVSNGDDPVFVWSSEELSDMGLTKGWQSNVANGEYTTSIDTGVVTTINNGDQWNGIIVGIDNSQVSSEQGV